jgi:hypothetical protein
MIHFHDKLCDFWQMLHMFQSNFQMIKGKYSIFGEVLLVYVIICDIFGPLKIFIIVGKGNF